jgi:PPP family 3-phenylpropionic acid transporter
VTSPAVDRVRASLAGLDGTKVRFQTLFFVNFVAFSGFAVFRNVYLEEMGMSGSAMGQIGFLMTATGVVAQPVWGLVTDYLHAERPVLVVGAVVSGVGLLAYPVADGLGTPFLLVAVGTAVYSAFRAPIRPVANSLVLQRGYDYGNIRAFGSIAFGIGSLGFGLLVASLGVVSVVYFYALGMVALVVVVWSVPERDRSAKDTDVDAADTGTPDGAADADSDTLDGDTDVDEDIDGDGADIDSAVRALVTNVDFLVVLSVAFLLGLSISGGSAFFSVYMREVGAGIAVGTVSLSPDAVTGGAWALKTVFEAVAFVYAVRLGWSYKTFLVLGGAAVTVPNLVYGLTADPWVVVAVQTVGGLGYGLYYVAAVNLVHVVADDRVASTAQSVLTGVGIGFGGAVGQVVAGELYDLVGIQRMYVAVAVIGFAGAAVGLLLRQSGSVGDGRAAV